MMVTPVVEQLYTPGECVRSISTQLHAPMLPTNSTLIPSCVIFFPSRTRTVTYYAWSGQQGLVLHAVVPYAPDQSPTPRHNILDI